MQGWWLALLLLLSPMTSVMAVEVGDEVEEFRPGLVAEYRVGQRAVERVDADVAFDWGAAAPDPRLPAGEFQVRWRGRLLVRQPGRYRLHAFVDGRLRVRLDGREVLATTTTKTSAKTPGWHSGEPVVLAFGERTLEIEYSRRGPRARVMLCWSSETFPLEPIPAHLLFRPKPRADLDRIDRGRPLFASFRCNRCHPRANDLPAPPGPDLSAATVATDRRSLVEQIVEPGRGGSHARMPRMGLESAEAEAIVAWLAAAARPVELLKPPVVKEKDREKVQRAGGVLLRSLGCLGCHRLDKQGGGGPLAGPDLAGVGGRRSKAWLATWLKDPARLNRDHRMPVFTLSDSERASLVLALSNLGGPFRDGSVKSSPAQIARGEQLVRSAECFRCHRVPLEQVPPPTGLTDLSRLPEDWRRSCLDEAPDRKRWRPALPGGVSMADRLALRAFVTSRGEFGLSPPSEFDRGRLVLEHRNCLACHERGTGQGFKALAGAVSKQVAGLRGQSQALIPPSLTAVGDKLTNTALAAAVAGRQPRVRLPWLLTRMPRFEHAAIDHKSLQAFLVAHDRIPPAAPATPHVAARAGGLGVLVDGQQLVGARGFSCIACHVVGDYRPRNVALGTRGSDLVGLGDWMRRDYFLRWCRSPLRIVPGMEMPSYVKAVPGLLGDDADRQLAATWDALADRRFRAPTNPTAVEQFLVVAPGDLPRIVRDVFTNPEVNGGGAVARGLAVGLPNGHNLLFDLDLGGVRHWTVGDFARQRTQGKSWYWDMAGLPVMSGAEAMADLVLVKLDKKLKPQKAFRPLKNGVTACRLRGYGHARGLVQFRYELTFQTDKIRRVLRVTETITPTSDKEAGEGSGWDRHLRVEQIQPASQGLFSAFPSGWHVYMVRPTPQQSIGTPSVTTWRVGRSPALPRGDAAWVALPGEGKRRFAAMQVIAPGLLLANSWLEIQVRYLCRLKARRLPGKPAAPRPQKAEPVTTVPGFRGTRLPLDRSIMPTAICWRPDGTMAFTSLKGHVYLARDTDGDGIEDTLQVFEEGLAAPYGIVADGKHLIVCHKPEVLRLTDSDGDGRADVREVLATGWGYSDNYHDWTCGLVRDERGTLYVALGSNYNQKGRAKQTSLWRGKVLKISRRGKVEPIGHGFRYPTGLAIDPGGRLFVSDNQGVQNTFNEINHLVPGRDYGVPSLYEKKHDGPPSPPAVQVPHPWTRSVNGLFFLPSSFAVGGLAGHGIGCEYDNRFLVRFTTQEVGGELQGAVYAFSREGAGVGGENFIGPLCGAVSPRGDLYIGSIFDSGWLGGRNTGAITRLQPGGDGPNALQELTAVPGGFRLRFARPIDPTAAARPAAYSVSGYTRTWKGGYATPDSGRHKPIIKTARVSVDRLKVTLLIEGLKPRHVYDVTCGKITVDKTDPWPATAHYTLHRLPSRD